MIVEIRNRIDEAVLVKIGVGGKSLESVGVADGEAIPIVVPDTKDLIIEVTKIKKESHCG